MQDLWTLTNGLEVLRAGTWDVVVLQDFSTLGQNFVDGKWNVNEPAGLLQWSKIWNAEIQRKNAKTLLYLTWARKAHPEFQAGLNYAYSSAAKELGAELAPVGLAWEKLRARLELFVSDGSHPSPVGTYVTSCVFLEVLLGKSCAGESKVPTIVKITAEEQAKIAEAAREAIGQYKAGVLTNLAKPDLGTLKELPTPVDTKPESFQGKWRGKARIYSGVQEVELQLSIEGRACKGNISIENPGAQLKLSYPLTNCKVDQVTVLFSVVDPRQMTEEFRAVINDGKLMGTHVLKETNPYKRMMGSFELKKD